ncbi:MULTISPECIES: hypothetical protein [Methylobacterium]|uniref:Uncharacterized protein n=1 Tax=Methylobacterium jeotgali TaxID=381630 RepID=A0ABQ4T023_9HYPH|nr:MULTISPECIES: hypothetical protein [Methylobacterium]PIU05823.1 MAG: hypothetical protein COT56_12890 [Methylobacterium sp. CG09_land_8_20_14_0_10_71_15]PIU13232.1 MAG: hypothetical protein COT28_12060 [Methylobacterium sp. CG08_land_8_20_14_0_20_71_15]GBU20027.1 hypothetical protein AwMethylo_42420 [Methylobacterium sp.]GJE07816.1 hypothetical protein AOPFMNJM_3146 [Methylobacterium jeotgali]
MAYTVVYTTPSGERSEDHPDHVRAIERALTFSGMGASDVHVRTAAGRVYRAPGEMPDLLQAEGGAGHEAGSPILNS